MIKRWHTIIIFCILFALTGVYGAFVSPTIIWGQDGTIPTRTPTPGAGQPTATRSSPTNTPPTSSAPTNTPASASTATSVASSTATATAVTTTVTPTSTRIGEFPYPEAEQCGDPPTITTLVIVNGYAGPGSDYPVVETLAKDEVRPIIGRAQYAEWWLILLDETGAEAWINNKAGVVNGYSGNVPIVAAPEIDGETPTPGTPWNPTPVPHCTVTPTATPTETATATQTPTPTIDAATSGSATSSTQTKSSDAATVSDGTNSSSSTETGATNNAATESNVVSGAGNAPQTSNKNAETGETAQSEPTAVPLETASSSSSLNNILPIVVLVLIVGAMFVILFMRRGRSGGAVTPTDE